MWEHGCCIAFKATWRGRGRRRRRRRENWYSQKEFAASRVWSQCCAGGYRVAQHLKTFKQSLPQMNRNEYKWKIKTGQRRSSHLPTGCFIHWSCCYGACWCFSPLCTRWTLGFLWNDPVSSLDCAKILCHILWRILPKIEPITVCNRMTHAIVHNYNHINHIVNLYNSVYNVMNIYITIYVHMLTWYRYIIQVNLLFFPFHADH